MPWAKQANPEAIKPGLTHKDYESQTIDNTCGFKSLRVIPSNSAKPLQGMQIDNAANTTEIRRNSPSKVEP